MTFIKNILKSCWNWAKRHIFHFIITMAVAFMGFSIVTQQVMINLLQSQIDQIPGIIKVSEEKTKNVTIFMGTTLERKIENASEIINARIDTIDSAIKPNKKRRMLITKIRDAIIQNVGRTIGVRDLNRMANAIIDNSYEFNLTIPQILAQIKVESNFNSTAKSPAGALGLMQIMPQTLEYIQSKINKKLNPYSIYDNINAGAYYISKQLYDFENYDLALQSYNIGPDGLKRYISGERKHLPEETINYVPRVKKYIDIFSKYGLE